MRALVTGCAGFIGSHLAQSLLERGVDVVGIDCFTSNYSRSLKLSNLEPLISWRAFEFVEQDLSAADVRAQVADCDVVFHLAAEAGVRTSWGDSFDSYTRNNILATQRLLEAVKEWPNRRFVYASSSSIYGETEVRPTSESTKPCPVSPYGVTKLAGEHLCRLYRTNYGVETVSLRYFSVFGPRQRPDMALNRFCGAALKNEPLTVYGDGKQTRDFTFVSDVVGATAAAAFASVASAQIYNIGGGTEISLNRVIELIGELTGRQPEVRRLAPTRGDVKSTEADTSRARAELGYEPAVTFEDGLRAQFAWMRENLHLMTTASG
jgi:UDP-glucuronate 4-epimerase